jgi:hypothetical protein
VQQALGGIVLLDMGRYDELHRHLASVSLTPGAEMVLFYCTFVALKARNPLTTAMNPNEYKLQREKRLFQAYVQSRLVRSCETRPPRACGISLMASAKLARTI